MIWLYLIRSFHKNFTAFKDAFFTKSIEIGPFSKIAEKDLDDFFTELAHVGVYIKGSGLDRLLYLSKNDILNQCRLMLGQSRRW